MPKFHRIVIAYNPEDIIQEQGLPHLRVQRAPEGHVEHVDVPLYRTSPLIGPSIEAPSVAPSQIERYYRMRRPQEDISRERWDAALEGIDVSEEGYATRFPSSFDAMVQGYGELPSYERERQRRMEEGEEQKEISDLNAQRAGRMRGSGWWHKQMQELAAEGYLPHPSVRGERALPELLMNKLYEGGKVSALPDSEVAPVYRGMTIVDQYLRYLMNAVASPTIKVPVYSETKREKRGGVDISRTAGSLAISDQDLISWLMNNQNILTRWKREVDAVKQKAKKEGRQVAPSEIPPRPELERPPQGIILAEMDSETVIDEITSSHRIGQLLQLGIQKGRRGIPSNPEESLEREIYEGGTRESDLERSISLATPEQISNALSRLWVMYTARKISNNGKFTSSDQSPYGYFLSLIEARENKPSQEISETGLQDVESFGQNSMLEAMAYARSTEEAEGMLALNRREAWMVINENDPEFSETTNAGLIDFMFSGMMQMPKKFYTTDILLKMTPHLDISTEGLSVIPDSFCPNCGRSKDIDPETGELIPAMYTDPEIGIQKKACRFCTFVDPSTKQPTDERFWMNSNDHRMIIGMPSISALAYLYFEAMEEYQKMESSGEPSQRFFNLRLAMTNLQLPAIVAGSGVTPSSSNRRQFTLISVPDNEDPIGLRLFPLTLGKKNSSTEEMELFDAGISIGEFLNTQGWKSPYVGRDLRTMGIVPFDKWTNEGWRLFTNPIERAKIFAQEAAERVSGGTRITPEFGWEMPEVSEPEKMGKDPVYVAARRLASRIMGTGAASKGSVSKERLESDLKNLQHEIPILNENGTPAVDEEGNVQMRQTGVLLIDHVIEQGIEDMVNLEAKNQMERIIEKEGGKITKKKAMEMIDVDAIRRSIDPDAFREKVIDTLIKINESGREAKTFVQKKSLYQVDAQRDLVRSGLYSANWIYNNAIVPSMGGVSPIEEDDLREIIESPKISELIGNMSRMMVSSYPIFNEMQMEQEEVDPSSFYESAIGEVEQMIRRYIFILNSQGSSPSKWMEHVGYEDEKVKRAFEIMSDLNIDQEAIVESYGTVSSIEKKITSSKRRIVALEEQAVIINGQMKETDDKKEQRELKRELKALETEIKALKAETKQDEQEVNEALLYANGELEKFRSSVMSQLMLESDAKDPQKEARKIWEKVEKWFKRTSSLSSSTERLRSHFTPGQAGDAAENVFSPLFSREGTNVIEDIIEQMVDPLFSTMENQSAYATRPGISPSMKDLVTRTYEHQIGTTKSPFKILNDLKLDLAISATGLFGFGGEYGKEPRGRIKMVSSQDRSFRTDLSENIADGNYLLVIGDFSEDGEFIPANRNLRARKRGNAWETSNSEIGNISEGDGFIIGNYIPYMEGVSKDQGAIYRTSSDFSPEAIADRYSQLGIDPETVVRMRDAIQDYSVKSYLDDAGQKGKDPYAVAKTLFTAMLPVEIQRAFGSHGKEFDDQRVDPTSGALNFLIDMYDVIENDLLDNQERMRRIFSEYPAVDPKMIEKVVKEISMRDGPSWRSLSIYLRNKDNPAIQEIVNRPRVLRKEKMEGGRSEVEDIFEEESRGIGGRKEKPRKNSAKTIPSKMTRRSSKEEGYKIILYANTDEKRTKGLMFHDPIGDDEVALFTFPKEGDHSFWNENVSFPLTLAFCDASGKILSMRNMDAMSRQACRAGNQHIKYVIEAKAGALDGINVGDKMEVSMDGTHIRFL